MTLTSTEGYYSSWCPFSLNDRSSLRTDYFTTKCLFYSEFALFVGGYNIFSCGDVAMRLHLLLVARLISVGYFCEQWYFISGVFILPIKKSRPLGCLSNQKLLLKHLHQWPHQHAWLIHHWNLMNNWELLCETIFQKKND